MEIDEIETKNEMEEAQRKNNSIKRRNTDEEVHFGNRDAEIAVDEKDVPIRPCKIFEELKDFKFSVALGVFGACLLGCLSPVNGYMMAKSLNGLNSKYETVRYDEGLKYSLIFLAMAFLQGLGNCIMMWKMMAIGKTLARIYRKKIFEKYLEYILHFLM